MFSLCKRLKPKMYLATVYLSKEGVSEVHFEIWKDSQQERLLEIANRCPVHKTLHAEVLVRTKLGR